MKWLASIADAKALALSLYAIWIGKKVCSAGIDQQPAVYKTLHHE
jgi:hypothetical protein